MHTCVHLSEGLAGRVLLGPAEGVWVCLPETRNGRRCLGHFPLLTARWERGPDAKGQAGLLRLFPGASRFLFYLHLGAGGAGMQEGAKKYQSRNSLECNVWSQERANKDTPETSRRSLRCRLPTPRSGPLPGPGGRLPTVHSRKHLERV